MNNELEDLTKAKINGTLNVQDMLKESPNGCIRYYSVYDSEFFSIKCLKQINQEILLADKTLEQIFKNEMEESTENLPQFLQQDYEFIQGEDKKEYFIISSELLPNLKEQRIPMIERIAKGIFKQLIEAFFELHYLNIAHFTICFEHIGYKDDKIQLQGYRFESHHSLREKEYENEDFYQSPENQGKTFKNQILSTREQDMYNLGAIMKMLIQGYPVQRSDQKLSKEIQSLLEKMMKEHYRLRLKWEDLLDDPYFQNTQCEPADRNSLYQRYQKDDIQNFYKFNTLPANLNKKESDLNLFNVIGQYFEDSSCNVVLNDSALHEVPSSMNGVQNFYQKDLFQIPKEEPIQGGQQNMQKSIQESEEIKSFVYNKGTLVENKPNQDSKNPVDTCTFQEQKSVNQPIYDSEIEKKLEDYSFTPLQYSTMQKNMQQASENPQQYSQNFMAPVNQMDQYIQESEDAYVMRKENQENIVKAGNSTIIETFEIQKDNKLNLPQLGISIIKSNPLKNQADTNLTSISRSRQEYLDNTKKAAQMTQFFMNERNKYSLLLNTCFLMYQQPQNFSSKRHCFEHLINYSYLLVSLNLNYDLIKTLLTMPFTQPQYTKEFKEYYKTTNEYENIFMRLCEDAFIIETWFLASMFDLKEFQKLHSSASSKLEISPAYVSISEELFKFVASTSFSTFQKIFELQQPQSQVGVIIPKFKLSKENLLQINELRMKFDCNPKRDIILTLIKLQIDFINNTFERYKNAVHEQVPQIQEYKILYLLHLIKAHYNKQCIPNRLKIIDENDKESFDFGKVFDEINQIKSINQLKQCILSLQSSN